MKVGGIQTLRVKVAIKLSAHVFLSSPDAWEWYRKEHMK
jgi:hypothetical protein